MLTIHNVKDENTYIEYRKIDTKNPSSLTDGLLELSCSLMCLEVFLSSEEYFNGSFILNVFLRNYPLNI